MRIPCEVPTYDLLHQLLDYDPASGLLTWRWREPSTKVNKCFNSKHAGDLAGSVSSGRRDGSNKYIVVGIKLEKYVQFGAHRLIWKMMTGQDPPPIIDHKDGNPFNLRWDNLRAADNNTNLYNSKLRKDNTSGFKGVHWTGTHKKWKTVITVDGKTHHVGYFATPEEAAAARQSAAQKLHGEFSRTA